MADTTMGTAARPTLFLRNATGLVKAWSTFDAFVYSFWSVNLITLGLYGMSFLYTVPDGQAVTHAMQPRQVSKCRWYASFQAARPSRPDFMR